MVNSDYYQFLVNNIVVTQDKIIFLQYDHVVKNARKKVIQMIYSISSTTVENDYTPV